MLSAFIDESYCDDWFFFVAAIVPDAAAPAVNASLEALRAETVTRFGLAELPELHGYEIFQGEGPWRGLPVHARCDVAASALEVLRDADVKFIIRGIDRAVQRKKYRDPYDPYDLMLNHIARSVDQYAHDSRTTARLVFDEYHHHDRHRATITRWRDQGTPGYRSTKLSNIVGDLQFIPSIASGMVQAADLVAYLKRRTAANPEPDRRERRARARMWRIVEPQIIHSYCWKP